jgi:hypothetical protein
MLPSNQIGKALMTDDLREQRAEQDAAVEETPGPRFQQLGSEGGRSEFERFEELTRKLVNVPKKELDEKRRGES